MQTEQAIFKKGSKTYFTSSIFFTPALRQAVTQLYSFVRVADDYVDDSPQQIDAFYDLANKWRSLNLLSQDQLHAQANDDLNTRVAKNIARLRLEYNFDSAYVDAFLASMVMDVNPKQYDTLKDSLQYVYGSAEVIGLIMARLMRLEHDALMFAALQGRAMQWINFVRDIAEDSQRGRCYFPKEDLRAFNLAQLDAKTAYAQPQAFHDFIQFQLGRYATWQGRASEGMHYIPRRQRVAVQTAVDGYNWTARQIAKKPLIVFEKTVKPAKSQLIINAVGHIFD